ncbi:MAG: sigma-70 family RNA polymerase sigma factor, partial [Duncaniella sp.]|nr:sigma-70 family RNA polymerase sigma factor [Duncaniella sp.]
MKNQETPSDEVNLVERLRDPKTCRAAFGDLIKAYSEPLYRQIRRLVQSHDDTDDILQNTFLKAWQNIHLFRGDAKLTTWLYKIAINESLSHLDREQRRRALSIDDEESSESNTLEAARWVDAAEQAQHLRKALA